MKFRVLVAALAGLTGREIAAYMVVRSGVGSI